MGASGCDKGVEEEGEGICVSECNGEEVCPGSDTFVYFGVGGSCVEKETVRAKYAFKGWGACEGFKVGKARGEGVGGCDWDGCGCVGGDDGVFMMGSAVFVAPVECGMGWDGLAWWEVDCIIAVGHSVDGVLCEGRVDVLWAADEEIVGDRAGGDWLGGG